MNLIGIYSKNRTEWMITDIACVLFGLVSVPLYDTLGI
jgi:long-chain acyl-CoA synthetase